MTGAEAAAVIAGLLLDLARVEVYLQWSDGTGVMVRRQRVTLYDGAGDILGAVREEHRQVLRALLRVGGGDWDRPQTFDVAAGVLAPTFPVVLSLPEALSDVPIPYALTDAHERECALAEQRHQLSDPAEPPLAVASLAADLALGYAETVDQWAERTGTERTAGGAA